MDIVVDPKVDWLRYKWYFICVSVILFILGGASLAVQGLNLGVDFTGGTLVYVKFKDSPELERIRRVLADANLSAQEVTRFDEPEKNEVQIKLARIESDDAEDLDKQSDAVLDALHGAYDQQEIGSGKLDLNNATKFVLSSQFQAADPLKVRAEGGDPAGVYDALAARIADQRSQLGGVLDDWSRLDGLQLEEPVKAFLKESFYLGSFSLLSVESVGPKVGRELRDRARAAVIASLLGMLVYIAFRFRPIYGVAAIVALFHDVLITIGFFSIAQKEISLTVIAALLTLVGYSINDTIVVFDRVRENLKLLRREDLATIINTSINQTLNRTIMTSSMTFLAVFALYWLGGQVLNGFSFALVIGIIVGTYSSIAIASPIVLWWQGYVERKKART